MHSSPAGSTSSMSSTSTLSDDPSTLSAINAQLLSHGWTKRPLNLSALDEKNYTDIVSVLFELLGSTVTSLDNYDALSARHRTLNYEHERLQKNYLGSKTNNVKLYTEIAGWKAKCADLEKRLSQEGVKVKELREEVGRGRKAIDGVRVAASHEGKKAQTRLDKAQAQLMKLSNDASLAARPQGLVILNPIHPGKGVPVSASQSPLLEQTIRDLVEIRQCLQEETEAFRHVLVSTGSSLRELLAEANGEDLPPRFHHSQFFCAIPSTSKSTSQTSIHRNVSSTSHPTLADAHLKSLISEIRAKINAPPVHRVRVDELSESMSEEGLEEKKRVEREAERILSELSERVKDLELEVNCAQAREDEAKKLVEEYARVHAETRAAQVIGEDGDLEKQRNDLDAERRAFSEATQRLGEERRRLEGERRALLEEKRRWDDGALLKPSISPIVKPKSLPITESVSSSSSSGPSSSSLGKSTSPIKTKAIPQGPPASPFKNFQPHSPSPLSPSTHKTRSPRPHLAGGKRKAPKTPLARLVLEKAVRQREKEAASASGSGYGRGSGSGSVFGAESGRRANVVPESKVGGEKGKGKEKVDLKASTRPGGSLGASARKEVGLKSSKAWR